MIVHLIILYFVVGRVTVHMSIILKYLTSIKYFKVFGTGKHYSVYDEDNLFKRVYCKKGIM